MTPGHNILGEEMELTDREPLELALLNEGEDVQLSEELREVHALLITLETIKPINNELDMLINNKLEMPVISMLTARSFGYQKILQLKQELLTQIKAKRIQEQYDEKYLQLQSFYDVSCLNLNY